MGLVPIYDARKADPVFANVLSTLKNLPRYSGDIPQGSCAVVAYTINTFQKEGDELISSSFNVHWAMLLALPGKFKK